MMEIYVPTRTLPTFLLLFLVTNITCITSLQANCKIKLKGDVSKYFRYLVRSQAKAIEFRLFFKGFNVTNLTRPIYFDELSNPKLWRWVKSHNEWFIAPFDSDIYTLGLVKHYVRHIYINFEVPETCRATGLDRRELFRQVYEKLEKIVKSYRLFGSLLCHEVNLCRSLKSSSPAVYRSARYLGMMRFVHPRKCCKMHRGNSTNNTNAPWDCATYSSKSQLNIINIVGAIIFAFSPVFVLKLFVSRIETFILLDNGVIYELNENHPEWLKPDENLAIFFWTVLRMLTRRRLNCFMRRFLRLVFVSSTPIVLYITLIVYYVSTYDQLLIYLIEGLPMGYLSMIFGVRRSFENTGGFGGGPVVTFTNFFLTGFLLISIPSDLPRAMSWQEIRQSRTFTFLQVNIEFLERYGGVEIRRLYGFERVYGILKARIMMVLNPSFWSEVATVWFSRMCLLTGCIQTTSPIAKHTLRFLVVFLVSCPLLFLCFLEASLCILYYILPISFIFFTVPKCYLALYVLPRICSHQIKSRVTGILLAVCIIIGFPYFYTYSLYVFCVSFFVVSRFVIQTFSVIILNPGYSMYLVAILFCLYYVHGLGRQFILNYRQLLSISIKISEKAQSEDKENFAYEQPFVLVTYTSEKYIRSGIFSEIISKLFPIRYELGWVLVKASVVLFFLCLSLSILCIKNTQTPTLYKTVWVFFTAFLPKFLNVVHQRKFCITRLEDSIYRILQNPTSGHLVY